MNWEGVDGLELVNNGSILERPGSSKDIDMKSSSSDDGSGDEYLEEQTKPRVTVKVRLYLPISHHEHSGDISLLASYTQGVCFIRFWLRF